MNNSKLARSLPVAAAVSLGVARCSSLLPITWARGLGSILGSACARLPVPMRTVTDVNLKLCYPEMSKAERKALLRRSLRETGKSMLELPAILFWSMKRLANLEEEPVGQELLLPGGATASLKNDRWVLYDEITTWRRTYRPYARSTRPSPYALPGGSRAGTKYPPKARYG